MSDIRVAELTSLVDVIKRMLRYVRRQKTLSYQRLTEYLDKKQKVFADIEKGQQQAYGSIEALYEKILNETQEELDKEKAKQVSDEA